MLSSDAYTKCLESIYPCSGLVVVGAGNGALLSDPQLNAIPHLLAIEADQNAFLRLEKLMSTQLHWKAVRALVSDKAGEYSYYVASNPSENGLLEPEGFKSIWPNLRTREVRREMGETLSTLMHMQDHADLYNWLRIDCFPAAQILSGLGNGIQQFDVIDLRLLARSIESTGFSCDKADSDAYLEPLGYRVGLIEECRNSAILRVIYIRDPQCQLENQANLLRTEFKHESEKLARTNSALMKENTQLEKDRVALVAARDEQSKRAQQLAQEVERLKQGKVQLEQDVASLIALRDEKTEQVHRFSEEIELLKSNKTRLERENFSFAQQRDSLESLAVDRLKKIGELQGLINVSQTKESEILNRQQLLKEELVWAEAQLELIKEMFISDRTSYDVEH